MTSPKNPVVLLTLDETMEKAIEEFVASAFVAVPEEGVPLDIILQRMFIESIGCGEPKVKFTATLAKLKSRRYH